MSGCVGSCSRLGHAKVVQGPLNERPTLSPKSRMVIGQGWVDSIQAQIITKVVDRGVCVVVVVQGQPPCLAGNPLYVYVWK